MKIARKELGLLVIVLVISALLLVFGSLAEEVLEGDTAELDHRIILLFRNPQNPGQPLGPPWLLEAMRDITSLGSTVVLALIFILVVVYLLIARKWATAVLVSIAVIGGQTISTVIKLAVERPRPELPEWAPRVVTASFPSGHAMLSAVTYLTIGALLARIEPRPALRVYLVSAAVLLTILVGVSRVYLGVHWPTDVLAGWSVGSAWALICWMAALWLQRQRQMEGPG